MQDIDPTLGAVLTAVIGAIGLVLAAKIKIGADRDPGDGPDWQRFTTEMQTWTKRQLAERDQRISQLEDEAGVKDGKLLAYRSHVGAWRAAHPDRSAWPTIPDAIRDDLAT